jgi:hypothetical protein
MISVVDELEIMDCVQWKDCNGWILKGYYGLNIN